MSGFEPERAGQTTAARVEHVVLQSGLIEQLLVQLHLDQRLVMAVPVNQSAPIKMRDVKVRRSFFEEFGQPKCLILEPNGLFVLREEVDQFIPEDGDAARLQAHEGNSFFDWVFERLQNLPELPPRQ